MTNPPPPHLAAPRPEVDRPPLREVSLVGDPARRYVHFAPLAPDPRRAPARQRRVGRGGPALRP